MKSAIEVANFAQSEVPVGAVITDENGLILAMGSNRRQLDSDVSAHAEILALREAGRLFGDWRLENLTMVVTLEPCVMCSGAIVAARLKRVVYGAPSSLLDKQAFMYDILRDLRSARKIEVIGGIQEAAVAS